jgi:hypothetical protein
MPTARARTWTLGSRSVRALLCVSLAASGALYACKSGPDYLDVNRGRDKHRDGGGIDDAGSNDGSGAHGGGVGGMSADAGNARFDASAFPPGATRDAAALDIDASLNLPDGSVILADGAILLPDGAVIDVETAIKRYSPEVDVATCEVSDEDTWSTQVKVADEGGFALVPGEVGFGLAYQGIGTGNCAQVINAMPIDAIEGFGTPHSVLPDCNNVVDVSLLSTKEGWRVAWVDNFTGSAELHTIALDSEMNLVQGNERKQLTKNDWLFEHRPVLREINGQPMVAWISEDTSGDTRHISTLRLDGDAKAIDVIKDGDGQRPEGLAFAQMGAEAAAVAWVGPIESPGVWLQKLDGNGAPVAGPIKLTDRVAASSSVDLANRMNGGAAIYSIEIDGMPHVRFQRLDATGTPEAEEREIIGPPLRGQSASLFALGGGYAVVYRALPGDEILQPEVRLTFITKEGNVMRDGAGRLLSFHIGDATLANARTYVAVAVEGEIMIAWIDADASGRNALKVVRRRLDCH